MSVPVCVSLVSEANGWPKNRLYIKVETQILRTDSSTLHVVLYETSYGEPLFPDFVLPINILQKKLTPADTPLLPIRHVKI